MQLSGPRCGYGCGGGYGGFGGFGGNFFDQALFKVKLVFILALFILLCRFLLKIRDGQLAYDKNNNSLLSQSINSLIKP